MQSGCYKINLVLLTATLNITDIYVHGTTKKSNKMPKLKIYVADVDQNSLKTEKNRHDQF